MADTLTVDIDDGKTATVTLDRPKVHNALNGELIDELTAALKALADNNDVRVMVLAANGKSFSAGADLTWMRKMADASEQENYHDARHLAGLLQVLDGIPKPTIARIHGAAYGGAIGLVACCDIAIASERAIFSLSEAKLGLVPAVISPYVVRAIGGRAARRYFQSAERFDAAQARHIGLIHQVVAADKLDKAIDELIDHLLAAGPDAQAAAKQLIEDVDGARIDDELMQTTAQMNARMRKTQEGKEGISAFLDKRKPAWQK
jgi:methylglutaconyl-CoA hydratase